MYHGEFSLKGRQRHKTPDDGGGGDQRLYSYLYNHRMYKKQSISKTNEFCRIRICEYITN